MVVSEDLGKICNAHLVHADLSEHGAMDEKCIQLAELAAKAVDLPKTGQQVNMTPALRPKVYLDFMEKKEHLSYKSEKILGRLYRSISYVFDESSLHPELLPNYESIPYDRDLEVPGASDYLESAWESKFLYDSHVNALLGLYRIRAEAEVLVGQVLSVLKVNSRKQGDLKEKIKNAYLALHREFRRVFETLEGDDAQLSMREKDLLFQRKASAWYQVTYHPDWVKRYAERMGPDGSEAPPRLSFAWIASGYLSGLKANQLPRIT